MEQFQCLVRLVTSAATILFWPIRHDLGPVRPKMIVRAEIFVYACADICHVHRTWCPVGKVASWQPLFKESCGFGMAVRLFGTATVFFLTDFSRARIAFARLA